MERHFDEELTGLKEDILRMGALVEHAIAESVEALKGLDKSRAQAVIDKDKEIDEFERRLTEECLDLLALRQPVAVDLRFITMAMKITIDLERMGDKAVDVAQRVVGLADQPLLKPLIDIPKLATLAHAMVHDSLDAFLRRDTELAKQVIRRDDEADGLRDLVQSELINDYMSQDPSCIPRAVPLMLIARHLERVCDHATNIAEDVIYLVSARDVTHHPEQLDTQS